MKAKRRFVGVFLSVLVSGWMCFPGCQDKDKQEDIDNANEEYRGDAKELTLNLGDGVTMKFVRIPAGTFMMGSPVSETERDSDEGPQHRVTISKPFYMGVHEVTQEQYQAVMGKNPSEFKGAKNPVEQVTWYDAVAFCEVISRKKGMAFRLPAEAEWEYACRAGTTTPFNTGETISTGQANYDGNHTYGNGRKGVDRKKTIPVGSFKPNAFGLYDMHGNVSEWCGDWQEEDANTNTDTRDPTGPDSGSYRVLRGGSWTEHPWSCRSSFSCGCKPDERCIIFGFRVVVTGGRLDATSFSSAKPAPASAPSLYL